MRNMPYASVLHDLFECKDGSLFWKITFNKVKAGDEAGYKTSTGYRVVRINNVKHYTHRLIYTMFNGEIPEGMVIDHVNCNRADNRIENLRICDSYQNAQNKSLNKNNKSGFKNVHWLKSVNKWKVQLRVNGKMKNIGLFKDLELADLVATEARHKFHGKFTNHGATL